MRKLIITLAAVSFITGTTAAFASKQDQELEAKCRKWAEEDGVPKAELAEYLKQCVEDLKSPAPEGENVKGQKGGD